MEKCTGLLACILDYRSLAVQIRRLKSEHRLMWMDESLLAHLARQLVFSWKHQPYSTINKGLVEDYIHPGAKWVFVGIPQLSSELDKMQKWELQNMDWHLVQRKKTLQNLLKMEQAAAMWDNSGRKYLR